MPLGIKPDDIAKRNEEGKYDKKRKIEIRDWDRDLKTEITLGYLYVCNNKGLIEEDIDDVIENGKTIVSQGVFEEIIEMYDHDLNVEDL